MPDASGCELCSAPGGVVLWSNEHLRVVRVDDPDYPGFLRVIWQGHVREMSDLDAAQRSSLLAAVFAALTLSAEVPVRSGSPWGCVSDRSGGGPPGLSRAREAVPHGGALSA